mgnify:CR=1 FL=1
MGEVGRMRVYVVRECGCVAHGRFSSRSGAPHLSQTLSAPKGQRGLLILARLHGVLGLRLGLRDVAGASHQRVDHRHDEERDEG